MTEDKPITADVMIQAFVKVRDQRDALRKMYEEADEKLKGKQQSIKGWLMTQMQNIGTSQLKGEGGVAYREVKRKYSCADWPNFWGWIKEKDRFDMLQKRVGERAVSEYYEETNEFPPGINVHQEYDIVIRRA